MFKSSDTAYLNPYNFNNISLIFGIGYGFCFNYLFVFLKSLKKRNRFYLDLGWVKDGALHSESFATSRTYSRNRRSTSFLNVSSCTFGTWYGREQIDLTSFFNSKSTGYIFQVPSFQSNNSSNLCINFSNSLRCVVVKCWHLFSITLCKSAFSYLVIG